MYHKFNANEILDMAIQIEKNGYAFYKQAAEDIKDGDIKSFLLELADMELNHEESFVEMKSALAAGEKAEVVFDPWEETAAYLEALAATRVFYEKKIDTTSAKEVLKEAIVAEKESIVFYLGMKDMVPEDAGKKRIDDIIREEMSHIQIISKQLLKLK
ncbi:ferritin family protein [bacterium]|nr:ferritin family protein [bacterium]